jgi:hypothetical protein
MSMANQGNLPGEDYQSQPPPVRDSWAGVPHRYLVTYPGQPEAEADVRTWQAAERAAGFSAPDGHNATAGFTGPNGISGRISFGPVQEEDT